MKLEPGFTFVYTNGRWNLTTGFKVGFHLNLSEILRSLKKGKKKENYFGNTTRQLTPTREHPRLPGDCLLPNIPINHPKILKLKTQQNIDSRDE